jgi:flavodoxin
MKALVVYDSVYGNTQQIAEAIAQGLGDGATSAPVSALTDVHLVGVDLLVVGCPINSWRPSAGMAKFLATMRVGQLKGVKSAAFDTRLKTIFHGDAAGKVDRALGKAGAVIVSPPQPFYVDGREGPLATGDLDRAAAWGRSLAGHLAA